jgi:ATP-dependent helicase/nuclease subunit B
MTPSAYAGFVGSWLFKKTVRPRGEGDANVSILNTIEARLLPADFVIMAGLNEGTFPAAPAQDPWMSRKMREEFGLPLPERKIGLSSHDFAEFLSYPWVLLTRAAVDNGTGQVASRWLEKLDVIAAANELKLNTEYSDYIGRTLELLDKPREVRPCARPAPRPPASARPKSLYATSIEKWYRDPYIIYAAKILGLNRLDDIAPVASAADFGNVVHGALEEFKAQGLAGYEALLELMQRRAADFMSIDEIDFWQTRFRRIARFVAEWEAGLPPGQSIVEAVGEMRITENFVLKARADRIDLPGRGLGAAIIDYKTGSAPTRAEIEAGYAPQLPLEAAIFNAGGFGAQGEASELCFLELGKERVVRFDAELLARQALDRLRAVAQKFEEEGTPYLSRPNPARVGRVIEEYSEYTHLARVREWEGREP